MIKVSGDKVKEIVKQASHAIRHLASENERLRDQLGYYERQHRVEKLASAMEEKNLDDELTHDEKVAKLMAADNLDVIEQAVGLASQQVKLASLSDRHGNASNATSAFEAAILGED